MTSRCPSLVIAGTASGAGKTSITLGLARALARRGLRVAPFKVGPDFLDPTYLARAAGRTCYNLDGWMTGRDYVTELFARATAGADFALVEGVMGLFDGASPTTLEGSTGQIAAWLHLPVLLIVSGHGAARSVAATVKGFVEFEPSVRIAGVIANQVGGDSHRRSLAESLAAAGLPPLLGAVPRGAFPTLASRHLGLISADGDVLPDATLAALADACEQNLDIDGILDVARLPSPSAVMSSENAITAEGLGSCATQNRIRIGLARDAAFHFYYPDNLQLLAAAGATLVEFSPLADSELPADLAGLYLGGGYPEVHAAQLSANRSMLESVRRFAASGKPIYAECGGMIYLGRSVRSAADAEPVPLAGLLPIDVLLRDRLKTLGYVQVEPVGDSPFGPGPVRGHEFHYSEIVVDDSRAAGWNPAWSVQPRRGGPARLEGFRRGNVLASYIHLHLASQQCAAERFVHLCEEYA